MRDQNWLFAYGSLMWDPGFEVAERAVATVEGFHRSFCLRSVEYRGTYENPGLVLGLDASKGASCRGVALRITDADWPRVLADVRARELLTDAYREEVLPLLLSDGREVNAIGYVMQPDHWQYAGGLCVEEQARIIAGAEGGRGPNRDYLFNTAAHLQEIGLPDSDMEALAAQVRRLCG
ncbi:gamma-glutamylcyclotransferase [Paracoccus albus]|uniref:gamma-glutamylcyclotransferase n=1 Tax=Paracoccus albus TaxID=3017784 RepID=UPI0022F0794C|nr:gamma-glutamylcyclotransferase [Paracoccus albus]WBU59113.1 gamma-glutamylcyclotransferase [Paracoccus albus]